MVGRLSLAALLLAATSCSMTDVGEWRYPGADPAGSHTVVSEWRPGDGLSAVVRADLAARGEQPPQLFVGDVVGGGAPEIVVAGATWTGVYNLRGRLVQSQTWSTPDRPSGFLFDFDADGKLDIVRGSEAAAVPDFVVENAQGDRLHRYAVSDPTRAYRSIIPVFDHADAFILGTQPSWLRFPRGIIKYSLRDYAETWEYFLPSYPGPVRLYEPEDLYLLSNGTLQNHEFLRLGTSETADAGFDRYLHLVAVMPSGDTRSLSVLSGTDGPLTGTAEILPVAERGQSVIVHRENEPGEPRGRDSILLIDIPSGIVHAHRWIESGHIQDIRVLPGVGALLAITVRGPEGMALSFWDADLAEHQAEAVKGETITLGPVIMAPEQPKEPIVLASVDDRLLAVSTSTRSQLWRGEHLSRMVAVSDSSSLLVAGVGAALHILRSDHN